MKTTRVLKSNTTALWLSHKTEQQMLWCLLYNTPQKELELSGNSCWLGEIPVHPSCPHQALCTHLLCDSLWLFHHEVFKADAEQRRLGRSSPPRRNANGNLQCKRAPEKLQAENFLRRVPTSPLDIARGHSKQKTQAWFPVHSAT